GVEQVHGAYSVALSNSLSRPARGRWSCWRSSAKSRGNSSRAANSPAQRSPALGVSTMELPRRFTWTLFPVTRYSLGSLTAWLRPVIKTFASATTGRDPVFRDRLCCFLFGLIINSYAPKWYISNDSYHLCRRQATSYCDGPCRLPPQGHVLNLSKTTGLRERLGGTCP